MQSFYRVLWCLVTIAAATIIAAPQSHFGYNYLKPNTVTAQPTSHNKNASILTATETDTEVTNGPTNARDSNGYEYRVVRHLKYRYRTQRDVTHLFDAQPHQHYLPPTNIYGHGSIVIDAPNSRISNDYLPPIENDVSNTEKPTTEAIPELATESTESPQDTAVFATDGYHYKKPLIPFELQKKAQEYLPPLVEDAVEAEGP